jgi:predicted alpha/beta-hydrolase family hydrolase
MTFGRALLAAALALAATGAAAEELARGGTGPSPAIAEVDASLDRHVVYRPANLPQPTGQKLGVLVWGNGACSDNSEMHAAHLLEIASHGYLVLASGFAPEEARRRAETRPRPQEGQFGPSPTTAQDMVDAIDWALAQDGAEGSKYRGLIDHSAIAAAGHSCGGIQALELGADPRVQTVIGNNTGILPEGASRIPGMGLDKAHLGKLHQPVLYLQGGETDIAYANGMDDYQRIGHVPVAIVNLPVGHGGTFNQPNGGSAASITVDWLEWRLRGDVAAGRTFAGENCRLCLIPEWGYEHKGF